jgi:hypothetical protein
MTAKRPRTMPTPRDEAAIRDGSRRWNAVEKLATELDAERAVSDALGAAIMRVKPMIGWQGWRPRIDGDPPKCLRCEYCDGLDTESPNEVKHAVGCPVPPLLAALARWQGTKEKP